MISTKTVLKSSFLWNTVFILAILVYIAGIFVKIMEPDAAVYASIPMTMFDSGNFLDIVFKGNDWLDKPHFQFWITAFSYKLLGVNNIGYKLPAILFLLLGVYYTFLFGKRFYSRKHGYIAALMLMTAQHIMLSNQDVRAEPYLTGMTIFSLYYFAVYLKNKKILYLFLGSVGLAVLLMTKGLFTIIPVAGAIGCSLLYDRKWKEIFHWQWLLTGFLVLILISPTLYGYYEQFDLHPEKEIFGKHGVSGIQFFFWDSQWGRFTNTGPIQGEGDPTFFLHTLLWAFAPWAFLAYFALYRKTLALIRKNSEKETLTYFGFMVMFILFSASKFQLPHYVNPILPLLAVVTTNSLLEIARNHKTLKIINGLQIATILLLGCIIVVLQSFFSSHWPHLFTILIWFFVLILIIGLYFMQSSWMKKILFAPALFILACNFYLNVDFYPELLKYQSESVLADYVKTNDINKDQLVSFDKFQILAEFYLHHPFPEYSSEITEPSELKGKYIFTSKEGLQKLQSKGYNPLILNTFEDFHITTLTPEFLNKKTRSGALSHTFLIQLPN